MNEVLSDSQVPTMRVLIVDDDQDTVKTFATLVRQWGYEVFTALGADEALAQATAFLPDVVFLDISLSEMNDGFDVAEKLLALDSSGNMRVIAVSGYAELENRQQARAVGIHEYLLKPVDPVRLELLLALRSQALAAQCPA
jgi:CheY-like chemotaxis protein